MIFLLLLFYVLGIIVMAFNMRIAVRDRDPEVRTYGDVTLYMIGSAIPFFGIILAFTIFMFNAAVWIVSIFDGREYSNKFTKWWNRELY